MQISHTTNVVSAPTDYTSRFQQVRSQTVAICAPLSVEDYVVQPIVDVSPPKWHLAHTTWFFEQFLLTRFAQNYQPYHADFSYLFNSYYESVGNKVLRPNRGNLTRPTVQQVYDYRSHVNAAVIQLLQAGQLPPEAIEILELGLQHEQQHQELLVTDIKYILGHNPLFPGYFASSEATETNGKAAKPMEMLPVDEGVYEIGFEGQGFCFDNELGRHKVFLHSYRAADRLITNGEYLQFMQAGGYSNFAYWYSDAWAWLQQHNINAPLYWHQVDGTWMQYTLGGLKPVDAQKPVTHISQYEAAAYAMWAGKRLLTEFEWETFATKYAAEMPTAANLVDSGLLDVAIAKNNNLQMWGDAWEWTNSAYLPYPFYKQAEGALGEYNGKFMSNQMVLRGGSCATPASHIRLTYRNFFQPWHRWQYTGIRLAETIA